MTSHTVGTSSRIVLIEFSGFLPPLYHSFIAFSSIIIAHTCRQLRLPSHQNTLHQQLHKRKIRLILSVATARNLKRRNCMSIRKYSGYATVKTCNHHYPINPDMNPTILNSKLHPKCTPIPPIPQIAQTGFSVKAFTTRA